MKTLFTPKLKENIYIYIYIYKHYVYMFRPLYIFDIILNDNFLVVF